MPSPPPPYIHTYSLFVPDVGRDGPSLKCLALEEEGALAHADTVSRNVKFKTELGNNPFTFVSIIKTIPRRTCNVAMCIISVKQVKVDEI